jgi:multiple sugar transport system permease protein
MQLKTANGDVAKLAAPGEIKAGGLSEFLVRDTPVAYAFIGPAFFLLLFLVAYPFALSLWFSLSDARVGETGRFIGLDNFTRRP